MQQKNLIRNIPGITLAAAGGWLAFNSSILNGFGYARLAMLGVLLLLPAWRLAAHTRASAWALLFAWHLGAGSAIPSGWVAFFGGDLGWAVWVIWAALAASPALLFPSRLAPLALAGGSLVVALTPIGMMNPIAATMAFFPGLGWMGALLSVALLALPFIANKRLFAIGAIMAAGAGVALDAARGGMLLPPGEAWAMETREGFHPTLAVDWFGRQARVSNQARDGIEQGARLVVTPEGAVDSWDVWAEVAWRNAAAAAKGRQAMLLVGVYRHPPGNRIWQDGLLDVVSGQFYGASVPMPISMWKPWSKNEHYPFDSSQLTRTIETPTGKAAYLLCFEEMLVWPLAAKMTGEPEFIISAANQWFTNSTTAETQERSVKLQARLWGLPLLRAVNWPAS